MFKFIFVKDLHNFPCPCILLRGKPVTPENQDWVRAVNGFDGGRTDWTGGQGLVTPLKRQGSHGSYLPRRCR